MWDSRRPRRLSLLGYLTLALPILRIASNSSERRESRMRSRTYKLGKLGPTSCQPDEEDKESWGRAPAMLVATTSSVAAAQDSFQRWWASSLSSVAHVKKLSEAAQDNLSVGRFFPLLLLKFVGSSSATTNKGSWTSVSHSNGKRCRHWPRRWLYIPDKRQVP